MKNQPPYKQLLKQTGYKFKITANYAECLFVFSDKQIALAFIKATAKAIYCQTGCLPYVSAKFLTNGGLMSTSYKYNAKLNTQPQTPHQSPHNQNDNSGQRQQRKTRRKTYITTIKK